MTRVSAKSREMSLRTVEKLPCFATYAFIITSKEGRHVIEVFARSRSSKCNVTTLVDTVTEVALQLKQI